MNIKPRSEFRTLKGYSEYLSGISELNLSAKLIAGRINRNYSPHKAITTPKVTKPVKNHPYRRFPE